VVWVISGKDYQFKGRINALPGFAKVLLGMLENRYRASPILDVSVHPCYPG
jgi:hypothetical protein